MSSLLWSECNAHPVVHERAFKRFLRFPPARSLEGPLEENASWARSWFAAHAKPWSIALFADASIRALAAPYFPGVDRLALIAVSVGAEPEAEASARWTGNEPDRYYFLDCYASAVTEALLAEGRRRLGAESHYCPGFRNWPITDNLPLLSALRSATDLPGPLEALDSGMLKPRKSQLALCALHDTPIPSP